MKMKIHVPILVQHFSKLFLKLVVSRLTNTMVTGLEAWAELTEHNESMKIGQKAVGDANATNGTLFQNMSAMGGSEGLQHHTANFGDHYTPLQFWFCRNPG